MTLLLIDGNAFAYRAYHGTAPLTRSDGLPVNGTFGFCQMFYALLHKERPTFDWDKTLCIFDPIKGRNHRHDLLPEYKANRLAKSGDLLFQLSVMKDACAAFNVPHVTAENAEADDLIGSYTMQAWVNEGEDVVIVTWDKDLTQLINPNVKLYDMKKKLVVDAAQVYDRFGVQPWQMVDYLALIGDATDNVPGVPGIGAKKAADLLALNGNLENILCNVDRVRLPKMRESLIQNGQNARLAVEVIKLKLDCPLPIPIADLGNREIDQETMLTFLRSMEFSSIEEDMTSYFQW